MLYESAVQFMAATKRTPLVYFTGDFAEAGASSPCHGDAAATAQRQILDIIAWDWATLKAALPKAKVYGSLGNHDSVPVRIPIQIRPSSRSGGDSSGWISERPSRRTCGHSSGWI